MSSGLQRRFSKLPAVERLAWEDREHFLLKVRRGTDLSELREAVRGELRNALEASRMP